jgi:hypothetical protein
MPACVAGLSSIAVVDIGNDDPKKDTRRAVSAQRCIECDLASVIQPDVREPDVVSSRGAAVPVVAITVCLK